MVADEVRKLSDQSFQSAKQIADIVGSIKKEIENTTSMIEATAVKLDDQDQAIGKVQTTFDQIEQKVHSVAEQQRVVKVMMAELENSKQVLDQSITSIATVAQKSAATSEETTSMNMHLKQSSDILYDMAENLKDIVQKAGNCTKRFDVDAETENKVKIALVPVNPADNEFNTIMTANAVKTAEKYNYQLIVKSPATPDLAGQMKVIEELESEELDYLILIPASKDGMTPVIERLHAKGVETICIDSDAPGSKRLSYIGTDNYQAGCTMGQAIARHLNGKASIIVSSPNETSENMKERIRGIRDTLKSFPNIKIIASQTGFADAEERARDLERVLAEHPDYDLIAGINTGFTAAIEKLRHKINLKGKKIIGFDKTPGNLKAIQEGTLDAVIAQRQDVFGELAIKRIYDHMRGNMIKGTECLDAYEINKISVDASAKR